ncbi:EAL domain-containing protein [Bradyrhizobium sp. NP1]|uniref:bifunctional diguanylate cyclase/phosphodiesterase n=1 Tax=Bradyrhizobium sp. NP1 TaxID=3049772 RepID=UPI0025A65B89|nr:EAL domain-containing protein [Bradyrhizobium sp. NP1]WJR81991.1 EAL domain-containing protein [Bradyrhizobium sp. NP1]
MSQTTAIGPRQIAGSIRRDPVLWLTICGTILIAAIVVGTAVIVDQFRERALNNATRELENTVRLLSRHFDQQFEDSEVIASDLIAQMQISNLPSAEAFRHKMSSLPAHEMLRSKISVLSYVGDVAIFDADGKLINWSGPLPLPTVDISDRDYYKRFKSDAHAPSVAAEAVRSYLTDNWTTVIANRLSGAGGTFLGVMTRRIDTASYEKFFASVTLGEGAAVSLFHLDGTLLARYPRADALIGKRFRTAPLLQRVREHGGQQTMRMESPVDHKSRLGSAAPLSRFPLTVIATNTTSAALADWREQTRLLILVAALAALVIALTLLQIVREIKGQSREAQRRLEDEKQRLDTALNNMTQGLVLYDASARIVTCNQRYIDMYGLSTDVVKPGCHFYDLIQHRKDTGSYDGDVHQFCSNIMRNVAQGKISSTIQTCNGDRSYLIVNKPLAQGGWVATIEDVTERQNLEQERDRNYTFLREIIDHIPSQITVKDARDRRYLLVNRVAEAQFGQSRDAIIGRTADDLFPKPLADKVAEDDEATLQSASGLFLEEHPWESMTAGRRYVTSRRIGIRDQAGEPRYIINVVEDVTERRRADEKIAHLAHYDALTDLPNRVLFREQIEHELRKTGSGARFALLYVDIDEFKGINDSLGHHVGDELLKTVAGRIRECLKEGDLIARLGGDEFAVIQTGVGGSGDVVDFVTQIHEAIRQPYQCLGHQLSTDASIGIALAPQDGTDLDQLIKNADLAMYAAKAGGRRTHRFFEPAMHASAKARLTMEQDLRQALADGGFEIHYQPLVDFATNEVSGCEALLRWRHPERGMISPAEFIPVAEDTGLINELGDWVLRSACHEAASWPAHIRLAVNVSPVQFRCPTLALKITGALAASGLPATRLELEITEAVLISDDEIALAILHQLRAIGVRIALDDFGTGYSSLSYLKRFPFDKIKIDRSFVTDITEPKGSSAIVRAVVNIAATRAMTTVAEGVETEPQREMLRMLGCTEMQGYLFSAPKPAAQVRLLLERRASAAVA